MNRLILIGNGFDLAHNLKTSYIDFIENYLQKCIANVDSLGNYSDSLIRISQSAVSYYDKNLSNNLSTWELKNIYSNLIKRKDYKYNIQFNSILIKKALEDYYENDDFPKWVDIENDYYQYLCEYVKNDEKSWINHLNKELEEIKRLLIMYLKEVSSNNNLSQYNKIPVLSQFILTDDSVNTTLFLDFNYTAIINSYIDSYKSFKQSNNSIDVISIHGNVLDESDIIFGYGDEEDENFKLLEKHDNECLKHIKTYWYLRSENYQKLLKFIDYSEFEVLVAGHSCGLSDKTLLSEIFNHKNCKKIRILTYYQKKIKEWGLQSSNYVEMSYNVGRLFEDKASLRRKLIPFSINDKLAVTYKS